MTPAASKRAIRGPRPAPGFAGLRAALAGREAALLGFVDRLERCLGGLAAHLDARQRAARRSGGARISRRPSASPRPTAKPGSRGCGARRRAKRRRGSATSCSTPRPIFRRCPGGTTRRCSRRSPPARWCARPMAGIRAWRSGASSRRGCSRPTSSSSAASTRAPGRGRRPTTRGCRGRCASDFGIAVPERAIGIAAHDFAQALGAPAVALTRATRREGVPTVPSRWLLRLDTVLRAVGLEGVLGSGARDRRRGGIARPARPAAARRPPPRRARRSPPGRASSR